MGTRSHEQVALLTDYDPGSVYSEAYHTLYANIRLNWDSECSKQHTLLLTAPSAYAEQAAVAANVAIAAAQSGTPTILVDADLRTPSLQQRFSLGKSDGLYELLTTDSLSQETLNAHLCQTFISGLRLLGAGHPKEGAALLLPTKLEDLISRICQFLAETETEPCLVIFNSSPVLSGPDASLIGALVDQTLLTIATGQTTRAKAKQAQEQLQRVHVNLVGIVMLDV